MTQEIIGHTLSHYHVLEKLGEGGMGIVFKAQDTRLNRTVVLKVLRPAESKDPTRERRFFQEARAASALNHPNIITIHDLVTEGDSSFIVMEYVQGQPLDFIIPSGGLPARTAIRYGIQIASALESAHATGIIHRDLKPGNVMITPAGLVKLLDFGLAKLTQRARTASASDTQSRMPLTAEGSIIGTVCYMSPEQAAAKPLDGRSDIFSFGTLLYEMVTGKRAFDYPSAIATLSAILNEMPHPPSMRTASLPNGLGEVIMRCLRKDPEARFGNAGELRATLEAIDPDAAPPGVKLTESDASAAGNEALEKLTAASIQRARECFERAASNGADAGVYAGMSEQYATSSLLGWRDPAEASPKAIWAARKALNINANLDRAQVTLGLMRANHDLRWREALPLLDQAGSAHQKLRRGLFYFRVIGDFDRAERDSAADPAALAWIALEKGDLAAADRHVTRADLESWIACWVRAQTLIARGRTREAIEACQSGLDLEPWNPALESSLAAAYVMQKQTDAAKRLVERAGWRPASFAVPYLLASGQADRAFEQARTALANRDPWLITVLRLPVSKPYTADPRHRELLSALGL